MVGVTGSIPVVPTIFPINKLGVGDGISCFSGVAIVEF